MNEFSKDDGRLSRIETLWSVVRQAHLSDADRASAAQQQLLDRYGNAVRRYLMGALKDANQADELFQEFAFKFLNGDFKSADPGRGKFRSYVKTILFRMVAQHFRTKKTRKETALEDVPELDTQEETDDDGSNELFLQSWREDRLRETLWRYEDKLENLMDKKDFLPCLT